MKLIISLKSFLDSFFGFILSILRIIVFTRVSAIYSPSKNKREKSILILGNGPSLVSDLNNKVSDFNKFDFLAVNHFAESDMYEKIKPSIYCIGAPELFEDKAVEVLKTKSDNLFKALNQKTSWTITLYLNTRAKKSKRWRLIINDNPNISIKFFNSTPIGGFFKYIFWRYNVGMVRPHNVLIPSIMIAINENYKTLCLFGADHSWLKELSVSDNNEALINQKHFYDLKKSKASKMRKDLKGLESRKLHEILYKFYLSFKGYHEINKFSKKFNVNIFNLTTESFIDAFERKEKC